MRTSESGDTKVTARPSSLKNPLACATNNCMQICTRKRMCYCLHVVMFRMSTGMYSRVFVSDVRINVVYARMPVVWGGSNNITFETLTAAWLVFGVQSRATFTSMFRCLAKLVLSSWKVVGTSFINASCSKYLQ